MARNKKPQKAYRPKPRNVNALQTAIKGTRLFAAQEKEDLIRPLTEALDATRKGEMTREIWTQLAGMVNTGLCLCGEQICTNFKPVFDATAQAMMDLRFRLLEDGRVTAYPAQLKQLEEAIELHSVQLDFATYRDYFRAQEQIGYKAPAIEREPARTRRTYVRLDVDTIRETAV